jgi:hypothetical protein
VAIFIAIEMTEVRERQSSKPQPFQLQRTVTQRVFSHFHN